MTAALPFRYEADTHRYLAIGSERELPHITGMLEKTGWVDSRWYTEESRIRGTVVHQLTADYDLGALDLATMVTEYRAYVLAHVAFVTRHRPTWHAVEDALAHATFRYAGRPDRELTLNGKRGVLDLKTGDPEKSHQIQTALQALLVAQHLSIPPRFLYRGGLYLQPNGTARLREHRDRRDFDEARRIIRVCCGV